MLTRRATLFTLLAAGILVSGCTTDTASNAPAYTGPVKTIRGYLQGPPWARLTASSVVFVTAYDASRGNSAPMPRLARTSFTLNRNGTFPVAYEIRVPAAASTRVALGVEITRAGGTLFSNDRLYSQTTGTSLNVPMREAPPRINRRYPGIL
ncbi:hypothetical protein GF108_11650 [Phyllobacterium sp. SYP-B3895]|uniref:Lipoprotein n=1 Tax=Phyllobacterium pellucidum TaxID=2740464 RepID=A0A849VM74_9HYPH|nr:MULTISPECIES: hypothetical protein [Phyllobacterium]MRG56233.1 hypothetical protein [Phyllobacterium sp. SYP-B3895]NTS30446.1 hypothetical protein [Phyllobacterium pellucidum]